MDNNSKSSSQIVDELFKELASKNFQDGRKDDRIEGKIEERSTMLAEKSKRHEKESRKLWKNGEKEKDDKKKEDRKNRKHKRSQSDDESGGERKGGHHHHHFKRKKKKSDETKRKHKHKHRRSKESCNNLKKRTDTDEEIEWQSDPERKSKKSSNRVKSNEPKIDFPEILKADTHTPVAVDIVQLPTVEHEVKIAEETDSVCRVENEEHVNSNEGQEGKIICIVKDESNSEVEEDPKSRLEIKDIKDCFVLQGTQCPEQGKDKMIPKDGEETFSSEIEDQSDTGSHSKSAKKKHRIKPKKKKSKESHDRKRKSRSRSVSRSRTRKKSTSRSRSRSKTKRKSRSKSSERRRGYDRKLLPSDHRDRHQRSHRHRSKSVDRTRPKSRSPLRVSHERIDKAKLLEIARKNAMMMVSQGQITSTGRLLHSQQNTVSLKSGGKSVAELTNFCKQLVTKGDSCSSDEDNANCSVDESGPFIQHPFKLKDPQPNIVMNIKNAVQVPIKTPAEKAAETAKLRIQFPVSSGSQHRKKESEWVPVNPTKEAKKMTTPSPPPAMPPPPTPAIATIKSSGITTISLPLATDPPIVLKPQSQQAIDVSSVISQRLKAVKKLQDNPNDVEALQLIYKAQQQLQSWAESKQLPGLFTGSTNARLLTPEELAGSAHSQAWVKKDQFNKAPPVDGGMGMYLLRKMGWNPGEGLGKNKEGVTLPLMLDIKMDKRGLTSAEETARKNAHTPIMKDLSGKHPVSALVELCSKRKWGPPDFILVHDSGPDHKKNFLFKVRVNSVDFQPSIASSNKKHAKAQAAIVCLQAMGLYPRDLNNPL